MNKGAGVSVIRIPTQNIGRCAGSIIREDDVPDALAERESESDRVVMRRYLEAREAGCTRVEAKRFSESDVDIGRLRRLVKDGCKPQLIAKILL